MIFPRIFVAVNIIKLDNLDLSPVLNYEVEPFPPTSHSFLILFGTGNKAVPTSR